MSKEQEKPDRRLKNIKQEEDASTIKDTAKLVEVRKTDSSADNDNKFVLYEKPFDEQMNESFEDRKSNYSDEDAD